MFYLFNTPPDEVLSKKPSEKDLYNISTKVGGRWMGLLVQLGVPHSQIEIESVKRNNNPPEIVFDCLVGWRNGRWEDCEPPTWAALLEALENGAEQREDAAAIRQNLLKPVAGKYNVTAK